MKKLENYIKRPNLYDYLKVIALITMLIDHIGYYVFPEYNFLRVIGRVSFPIFLFLVGFSGSYKRRRDIPLLGIFLWGFSFFVYNHFGIGTSTANILIGITISRFFLNIINQNKRYCTIVVSIFFAIIHPIYNDYVDYGSLSFFFSLWGRIARYHKNFFYFGIIPLLWGIVDSILVFNFGFKQGDYTYFFIICVLFFVICGLFLILSKNNIAIITEKKWRDLSILWFSKQALAFYGVHIIILSLIGLFRFGFL